MIFSRSSCPGACGGLWTKDARFEVMMMEDDEHGLFVYRAIRDGILVYKGSNRSQLAGSKLQEGQVVSACLKRQGMIQLEDGSGWVQVRNLEALEVEYTPGRIYTTTTATGVSPRRHPDHDVYLYSDTVTLTGLVNTCARVLGSNGVYFIRREGRAYWLPEIGIDDTRLLELVFEMGMATSPLIPLPPMANNHYGIFILRVEGGDLPVRQSPSMSSPSINNLPEGTVVCCLSRTVTKKGEVFLELEGSSDNMGSAGYIPELGQGQAVLVPMALDYCPKATYWVTNGGSSLAVRYQPDHDQSYKLSTDVLVNGIVECFARVVGTTGDMYIRLHRGGWLFATRDGEQTLQPLSTTSSSVGGGGGLFSTTALPLDRVRALALRCGAYENYFNGHSRVVFFIKDGTRINVYYTTGTVGTCLVHPSQGPTQMFRREVDLTLLQTIFTNPRVHTGRGYKTRQHMPPSLTAAAAAGAGASSAGLVLDEEEALEEEINRMKEEALDLCKERQALEAQLEIIRARARQEEVIRKREAREREKERRRQAQRAKKEADKRARRERERADEREGRVLSSTCAFTWWLTGSTAANNEIKGSLNGHVTDVAITRDSYFICNKFGAYSWKNVPKLLYNKVRGRQSWLPSPVHVALGPSDQYVILFADGDYQAMGPDDLYEALDNGTVERVALGRWGVWWVLYEGGGMVWSADLPTGLYNQLNSRNPRLPPPVMVSIGPEDEWFVTFADGKWRAGGHSAGCTDEIEEIESNGYEVRRILFGKGWSYLICYE